MPEIAFDVNGGQTDVEVDLPDLETDEDSEEFVPPTKEEWAKAQKDLKRANDQAAKYRNQAKVKVETPTTDLEAAREEARQEERDKAKRRIINSEAKAELSKLGFRGDIPMALKMVDLDEIDIDDEGAIGLNEQLEILKDKFPALFAPEDKVAARLKRDPRTAKDASDRPPAKTADSWAKKVGDQLKSGR